MIQALVAYLAVAPGKAREILFAAVDPPIRVPEDAPIPITDLLGGEWEAPNPLRAPSEASAYERETVQKSPPSGGAFEARRWCTPAVKKHRADHQSGRAATEQGGLATTWLSG